MELQNVNASEFSNVHGATRMRIKANALQRMAKTAFLTTLASLILHAAPVAASPKVTSFTPLTGPVGSTITIEGSDFSIVAAENHVDFHGVPAVVASASSSSLSVIVPEGADSGGITVEVDGQASTSERSFLVTTTGTAIPLNGSSIDTGMSVDSNPIILSFDAVSGDDLGLGVSSVELTGSGYVSVRIYRPGAGGTLASSSQCVPDCVFDLRDLPDTGTYQVWLNASSNRNVRAIVTLSTTTSSSIQPAAPMPVPLVRPGQIMDLAFDANSGDAMILEFTRQNTSSVSLLRATSIRPRNPDGTALVQNGVDTFCAENCSQFLPLIALPQTGTYSVSIQALSQNYNPTTIVNIQNPTPISIDGDPVQVHIDGSGWRKLLSFEVTQPQRLGLAAIIPIDSPTGGQYHAKSASVTIYSPTGAELAQNLSCRSLHDATLPIGYVDQGCGFDLEDVADTGKYTILIHSELAPFV